MILNESDISIYLEGNEIKKNKPKAKIDLSKIKLNIKSKFDASMNMVKLLKNNLSKVKTDAEFDLYIEDSYSNKAAIVNALIKISKYVVIGSFLGPAVALAALIGSEVITIKRLKSGDKQKVADRLNKQYDRILNNINKEMINADKSRISGKIQSTNLKKMYAKIEQKKNILENFISEEERNKDRVKKVEQKKKDEDDDDLNESVLNLIQMEEMINLAYENKSNMLLEAPLELNDDAVKDDFKDDKKESNDDSADKDDSTDDDDDTLDTDTDDDSDLGDTEDDDGTQLGSDEDENAPTETDSEENLKKYSLYNDFLFMLDNIKNLIMILEDCQDKGELVLNTLTNINMLKDKIQFILENNFKTKDYKDLLISFNYIRAELRANCKNVITNTKHNNIK